MLGVLLAQTFELLVAALDVGDQLLGEGAVLDVAQDGAHALFGVGVDDARARQVAAEFGGVGHRVVHPRDAALVHQVDDQLELVQHLEVGHLRRVARLDHHVETGLHQFLCATAQHGLLTEQVGFGLVFEGGLDDAGAGAADGLGVGQRQRLAVAVGVLVDGDQRGNTLAVDELTTHQVPRAFRRHHRDGDVARRLDQIEVDVEPVPEEQRIAILQVGFDLVLEDVGLRGVGRQQHDHVGPLGHLGRRVDGQALLLDLCPRLRALFQPDPHLDSGVTQAQRVRVPLTAVADHTDLAALNDRQVRIVVVKHLQSHLNVSFFFLAFWGSDLDFELIWLFGGTDSAWSPGK